MNSNILFPYECWGRDHYYVRRYKSGGQHNFIVRDFICSQGVCQYISKWRAGSGNVIVPGQFDSREDAMAALDNALIAAGFILMTEDEYAKYQILI